MQTLTSRQVATFWNKAINHGDHEQCWDWAGYKDADGYGRTSVNSRMVRAHRLGYELLVGPIPEGLCLDHLCRNRACVNPDHLEPVTNAENAQRGNTGKYVRVSRHSPTECANGHSWTVETIYINPNGSRACRICKRAGRLRSIERQRRLGIKRRR